MAILRCDCGRIYVPAKEYDHQFKGTQASNLTQTYPKKSHVNKPHNPISEDLQRSAVFGVLAATLIWFPWWLVGGEKHFIVWCVLAYVGMLFDWQRKHKKPTRKHVGKRLSKQHKPTIKAEITTTSDDDNVTKRFDLPCSEEALIAMAKSWLDCNSIAQDRLTGTGKPFSRREYVGTCDRLIKSGILQWINGKSCKQGKKPTRVGVAWFEYLVGCPLPQRRMQVRK